MTGKQKKILSRIIVAAVLMIVLHFLPVSGLPLFFLYLIPYLIIGHDILRKAWKGIVNRQVFDENFLMAVATVGALAIGLLRTGDYEEAVAVMLFYQIGELFQSLAVGRSRRSISELMDIRPDHARVEADGQLTDTDPDEVEVGSVIVVDPGERIPLDGTVISGESSINTSALTGESVPRDVKPGDEVISGCVNMSGVLRIRTTKVFGESTVSRVLDLVENASSRRSRSENFITRFARWYTPVVVYGAAALAVVPPVVRMLCSLPADWSEWIYRALTFLVISCPCALVISIPLTFFAGIGGAGKEGILIKGSNYLEAMSKTGTVVFDKTGTLTKGVFEVTDIHHSSMDRDALLEYAALAESASTHPIAVSIRKALDRPIDRSRVTEVEEISGSGVIVTADGKRIAAGNSRLMRKAGVEPIECHSPGTVVHIAVDGSYCGHIVIADIVKPRAAEAIAALRRAGVRTTVMLTGDTVSAASPVAEVLDIDRVHSDLLPEGKVEKVEELLKEKRPGETLAFAGDGINDAPVLSRADVGIAMGALGSDAAIEAADVVLMDDDPMKIAKAIRISRKCMRIVYQNIVFAIGVKAVCLALGALGIAGMWLAVFADVGVMVLAVLNAIRALFVSRL